MVGLSRLIFKYGHPHQGIKGSDLSLSPSPIVSLSESAQLNPVSVTIYPHQKTLDSTNFPNIFEMLQVHNSYRFSEIFQLHILSNS